MNNFEKYNIPYDVDTSIRDFIIELNQHGYRTFGSCSGHVAGKRGFVTIALTDSDINIVLKIYSDYIKNHQNKSIKLTPKDFDKLKKEEGGSKPINKKEIFDIAKKHGLQNLRFTLPGIITNGNIEKILSHHYALTFDAVPSKSGWG